MDLLATIQREAVDPEYRVVSSRPGEVPRNPLLRAAGLALAAALIATAAVQTARQSSVAQSERTELIGQIQQAEKVQDATKAQVAGLDAEVRAAQAEQLPALSASQQAQAALAGLAAVTGPGITVVVDDATPTTPGTDTAHVTDQDLRQLVNGLWSSGAEAIAVNGHRVTARTAIRMAGSAITVDYRSLTRPYRVEAIGDPKNLGSQFAGSDGGRWWAFLRDNYGLALQVTTADRLTLPADPGLGVSVASAGPS